MGLHMPGPDPRMAKLGQLVLPHPAESGRNTHEGRDGKDITKYSHCGPGVESRAFAEDALWGEGACGKCP